LAGRYKLLGQFIIGGTVLAYVFYGQEHVPPDWWEIRDRLSIPFVAFNKHPIRLPIAVCAERWVTPAAFARAFGRAGDDP
jgi:phospho-N-acetylmuramoyl-pentapeptide-transferase